MSILKLFEKLDNKNWLREIITDPIDGSSFVAADSNFDIAADDRLLEERHGAPPLQFVARQPYLRQFLFGRDRPRIPPSSPLPRLLILFRVGTPRWHGRCRRRRRHTASVGSDRGHRGVLLLPVFIPHHIRVILIIRVHILGLQSLLLQTFPFGFGLLLFQQLR